MENRSHALMAGLFTVLFVLAAAAALWWFSGTRELTHTYLLETRGNVTGLNVEAQVRYRGIRAGKVTAIRPDDADPAKLLVEITLGRQYRLTDRTIAKLNFQGITGLAYVMLEEGGEGAGTHLDPAADMPPRIAIQPGLFDRLGDKAGDIAGQMAELGARLNRLLDDRNMQNLSRTLDNLAAASEGLRELPRIAAALRVALSDENLHRLTRLLAHLEQAAGEAGPMTVEARALVAHMSELTRRLDRLAAGAGERLGSETLPRAEAMMAEISLTMRRLDRLIETLADTPQSVIFGTAPKRPGPGESGFVAPATLRKE